MKTDNFTGKHFRVTTSLGDYEFTLYETISMNYKRIITTFCNKCVSGYYDNLIFFRVSPLNYLQTGHNKNTGIIEPSKTKQILRFEPEVKQTINGELKYETGLIVKTNDFSKDWQFTILFSSLNSFENNYIVLGKVTKGLDVLERLSLVETTKLYEPKEDIRIIKIRSQIKSSN